MEKIVHKENPFAIKGAQPQVFIASNHLSLIDGTICMEGLGPSSGKTRELGVVLVGADPFAADAVACALMGVNASDSPHLRIAAERKYGEIDINNIAVIPENWQELGVVFEHPPENLSIEFPNISVHDKNSCSACQSTLLLLLKRYGKELFDYFTEGEEIQIAIGKGHESLPAGSLCIGNCTANVKAGNIFIKGCPPVPSEIM